ncbi:MAG: class I SAM-dependent methyltransferase [Nitrospiraceae bacterium]
MTSYASHYWDGIAIDWQATRPQALWRAHSDAVNVSLMDRWLPRDRVKCILKTDVFDEAVGDGLYPLLASRAESVVSMDVSFSTLHVARSRHAKLRAVGADTCALPFADGTFDAIVSNSTLDHFHSRDNIVTSLRELRRVLKPGGQLLLTLDNLANPVIAVRNRLPCPGLNRLGLVPYYVGAACGPRRLSRWLQEAGLEVVELTSVMHCPRLLAVQIAGWIHSYASASTQKMFLRWLMKWERWSRWPTRFLTGHFIAVRCLASHGAGS